MEVEAYTTVFEKKEKVPFRFRRGMCRAVWIISSLQWDCGIISIPLAIDSDVC